MRRALNLQLPPWPLVLASGLTVVAAVVWQSWDMPLNIRRLQQPAFREAVFDAPMAAAPGTGLPPELVSDETPVPNETPAAVAALEETATPEAATAYLVTRSAVQAAAATGTVQPVATPAEPTASVAGYQGPSEEQGVAPLAVPGELDASPNALAQSPNTGSSDDTARGRLARDRDNDTSPNSQPVTTTSDIRHEPATIAAKGESANEPTPTAQPAPQVEDSQSLRGR